MQSTYVAGSGKASRSAVALSTQFRCIVVPTGVSEDEAVQMVQEQFSEAGFECPDDRAREIVREAWAQQQ
jgi:hypothetical protein